MIVNSFYIVTTTAALFDGDVDVSAAYLRLQTVAALDPINSIDEYPVPAPQTPRREQPAVAGYPRVIWLLVGGSMVVRASGFAYPFMAYHVAERGHAAGAVGAVLAAFGVGWAIGQLLCGWLVDRFGARLTLVSTMTVAAGVLIVMAGARTVPALLIGAFVTGVVYDAVRPALGAAIVQHVSDPVQRAKIDGWRFGWIVSAGRAITGGVGGVLVGWSGVPLLYWVNGGACALFAVVAACCISRGTDLATGPATGLARRKSGHLSYRQAFADRRLLLLFLSGLATLTAVRGLYATVPMLMADRGLDAGRFAEAQLANALTGLILTPLLTPCLSKVVGRANPRLDILAVASVWTALCMGAVALARTPLAFIVATALCTPGEIACLVIAAGVVHQIAPPDGGGRYHGAWSMALAIASVIAPIMASSCLMHGGHQLVAFVTVTIGLIGAGLCLPLARALGYATHCPFGLLQRKRSQSS